VDSNKNSNPKIFIQYNCYPLKGKNVSREKDLANKEFALTLFFLLPDPDLEGLK
jgi:hypothetical protein